VIFNGSLDALIPLYAVGVFRSFTLSQAGMVVHWRRLSEPGWKRSAVINGLGAVATAVVTLVIAVTKSPKVRGWSSC
jgi:amino acid transporter